MAKAKLEALTIQDENDEDFPIIKLIIPKKQLSLAHKQHFYPMNTDEARELGKALIKLASELDMADS